MNQSIDDLPAHILIEIISNLSSYIADYLPLKLVSSKWNYAINCHFESIRHLAQRKLDEEGYLVYRCEVTKDGLIACKTSKLLDQIISCMKLLPNLTAVSVEFSNYTKEELDTLFSYLNTRPTITSLELVCGTHTKLQNNVKLENIRNFALYANSILSEDAIKRLFQADHKLTQLYVYNLVCSEMPLEDGISILKRMPSLKRFSQHISFSNFGYAHVFYEDDGSSDLIIYTKQPGLSFENLESYSFAVEQVRFLNYVDNFVACCPNLKNIDCDLWGGSKYEISTLDNLRVHTNVENLVISGYNSWWEIVLKVLEMFPMIKNLKLEDMKSIGHNQISQALLKLPNLSLLYLRDLEEFPKRYSVFNNDLENIVQVDCMALKDEYNSKYGRNLRIVKRNGCHDRENFSFRHGSSFMEKIFWPDWSTKLLTD